jgi:iron complex outermembrane recepter protein
MNATTERSRRLRTCSVCVGMGLGLALTGDPQAASQQSTTIESGPMLEEIIVTARHRSEDLQKVPDAITVFNADRIEQQDIRSLNDYARSTPGLYVREGYRSSLIFLTMRGVTTGQLGWAPITYTVDGVKAGAIDVVSLAALTDVERIEVLRGPQSALYGAGAIAGAINIVTNAPSNDYGGQFDATYGTGSDLTLRGAVTGPIVKDKLTVRLSGYYRDTDGLIQSSTGDSIDFSRQSWFKARTIFTPNDTFSIDLRAAHNDTHGGAIPGERFDDITQLNVFNDTTRVERGIRGTEDRTFTDLSAKMTLELSLATLTSVTGYGTVDQSLFGTASYTRAPALGEAPVSGFFGPIFGANAGPGDQIDAYQGGGDDYRFVTQDLRLTSADTGRVRWVVGADYLKRDYRSSLQVGAILGPLPGTAVPFIVDRVDDRKDEMFGIYAQVETDLTESLELTIAGRYDEDDYSARQIDPVTGQTVPQLDPALGAMVDRLETTDSKFQPKIQLSRQWSPAATTYLMYSEGFRYGFFNFGSHSKAETTRNYEVGVKTSFPRLMLNAAAYYTTYSNQQTVFPTLPIFTVANIPKRNIYGTEVEMHWLAADRLDVTVGVNVLNAGQSKQDLLDPANQVPPEAVPEFTANVGLQWTQPAFDSWDIVARTDWYYQDRFPRPVRGSLWYMNAVNILDLQLGLKNERWGARAFAKNILDERYATDVLDAFSFFVREYNRPRSYGVELSYRF